MVAGGFLAVLCITLCFAGVTDRIVLGICDHFRESFRHFGVEVAIKKYFQHILPLKETRQTLTQRFACLKGNSKMSFPKGILELFSKFSFLNNEYIKNRASTPKLTISTIKPFRSTHKTFK